jgi:hypothetical protein
MNSEVFKETGAFCYQLVWLLGVIWLVIQIVRSLRRSPPAEKEFSSKTEVSACQANCATHRKKSDEDNLRRDKESTDSRAKLYGLIEKLRADMDAGLRELGEQGASQQTSIDLQGQLLARLDHKIDAIRDKL